MRLALCVMAALLFPAALVAQLVLRISPAQDTVLPYEPLHVSVWVKNCGRDPAAIPNVGRYNASECFRFDLCTTDGKVMPQARFTGDYGTPEQRMLSPGESVETVCSQMGWSVGQPDEPAKFGGVLKCLPVGNYEVRARWQDGLIPEDIASECSSSAPARFVVRGPTPTERAALGIYREARYLDLGSLSGSSRDRGERLRQRWSRVDELARRIIRDYPSPPYSMLAKHLLIGQFWEKAVRDSQHLPKSQTPVQWKDSSRIYVDDVITNYPASPFAASLVWGAYLHVARTAAAQDSCLQSISDRRPGTRVDREAKRVLEVLRLDRTREKEK